MRVNIMNNCHHPFFSAGVASRSSKKPLKKANFPLGFEKFKISNAYSDLGSNTL